MKLQNVLLCLSLVLGMEIKAQSLKPTRSLFNGQNLDGWATVDPAKMSEWSVVDSTIRSGDGTYKIPTNTYLYTKKEYADFEFSCLFKIWGDASTGLINSGIQYRSLVKDGKMIGYQADIGKGYWGDIYDEHRRGKLVGGELSTLKHVLNPEGWNSYIIRCKGPLHEIYINGVKTASYIEKDQSIPQKGVIAVQIHSGGKAQVAFRDLTITEL